mgnify:FL=1
MATGKKSFVAYADWKDVFDELPDEDAGKLIKHIFAYVNDENPKSESVLIHAVLANIKNTLKRDKDKWELQIEKRRKAGQKSAEMRATKSNERSIPFNEETRNPTVSDNVNVSVNDNDILLEKETKDIIIVPEFNFKNSLIDLGIEKEIVDQWLLVRKTKKAVNTEIAFQSIKKELDKTNLGPNECIKIAVEHSWSGYKSEWINNLKNNNNGKSNTSGQPQQVESFAESSARKTAEFMQSIVGKSKS